MNKHYSVIKMISSILQDHRIEGTVGILSTLIVKGPLHLRMETCEVLVATSECQTSPLTEDPQRCPAAQETLEETTGEREVIIILMMIIGAKQRKTNKLNQEIT